MKSLFIFIIICISFAHHAISQNVLSVNGFKFNQGNKKISLKEAHLLLQNNTNANQTMWESRSKRSNSYILAGFASVGVGIPIYTVIKQNSISWFFTRYTIPLMLGGITCGVISIKANIKAKRLASEAVNQYNKSSKISYQSKPKHEILIGFVGEGVGVHIDF